MNTPSLPQIYTADIDLIIINCVIIVIIDLIVVKSMTADDDHIHNYYHGSGL